MEIKKFKQFEADYKNSNGGKFWGDAGAGILVFAKSTRKFLISLRGEDVNEPLTYGVIGGMAESTDFQEEALRELEEETGYTGEIELTEISRFEKIRPVSKDNPYKTSEKVFEYVTYLGIIEDEFKPKPHPAHEWENADLLWVTFDELIDIEPKHFGLKFTLKESKSELSNL